MDTSVFVPSSWKVIWPIVGTRDSTDVCVYMCVLVHKQMWFLTFEGLTNVYHNTNLLTFVTIGDNTCTTVY